MTSCNDNRPDPVEAHIGAKLRELREARGVSQDELGAALGATCGQIDGYETALSAIDAHTLLLVAKRLAVGVEAFFEGLAQPAPTSLVFWEQVDPKVRKAAMRQALEPAASQGLAPGRQRVAV